MLSPDSNPPTHYSSQDSLPDSPYSSQSLESHPEPSGGDQKRHTRGSLPNLNKRGAGAAGRAATGLAAPGGVGVGGGRKASASATRAPTAAAGSGYGLSRHHTSSDPRLLQQQKGRGSQMQIQPPQRGYSAPRGGDRRTPEVTFFFRFKFINSLNLFNFQYQAGYGQQPRYPGAGAGARPAAGSGLRQPSAVSSAQNPGSRLARPAGTGKIDRHFIYNCMTIPLSLQASRDRVPVFRRSRAEAASAGWRRCGGFQSRRQGSPRPPAAAAVTARGPTPPRATSRTGTSGWTSATDQNNPRKITTDQ